MLRFVVSYRPGRDSAETSGPLVELSVSFCTLPFLLEEQIEFQYDITWFGVL